MKNIIIYFVLIFSLVTKAEAITRIDITKGNMDPIPIAITDFIAEDIQLAGLSGQITSVIKADLERSGLFRPISENAFIERIKSKSSTPDFSSWRQINASGLVIGGIRRETGNQIELEFRLWDPFSEQQIAGKAYISDTNSYRRVAHMVADEIYKRFTGENGYFDTRIVYVSESGPGQKRIKRLAIMDQDGENHKFLTDGRVMALTPRFSPNAQKILYMSYQGKKPKVYLRDIETGRERLVGEFPGMSFAPRFSPDGVNAVMSIAAKGATNLYVINLTTMQINRLTSDSSAINTSPSYSPDGKKIVFNSDRGGSGQLYVMNPDGSDIKRISFGGGTYSTPVWSPRGDLIAFTVQRNKEFYIGVMRTDGSGERILSGGYLVEGPTWAPNGRVIIFTRAEPNTKGKVGASRIYSIDLTGYNEREIVTPMDASDPAWSPLLD